MKKFWICFLIISLFSLETKAQDEDFDVVQNEELGYVKLLEKPKCSNKELQKKIDGNKESNKEEITNSLDNSIKIDESGSDTIEAAHKGSEQVLMGKKAEVDHIRSKGDNYGVASIVNPYLKKMST